VLDGKSPVHVPNWLIHSGLVRRKFNFTSSHTQTGELPTFSLRSSSLYLFVQPFPKSHPYSHLPSGRHCDNNRRSRLSVFVGIHSPTFGNDYVGSGVLELEIVWGAILFN